MANIANNNKTFTAKVIIPNQPSPKYIPNATLYKGKLVQLIEIGVGTPVHKSAQSSEGDYDVWEEYPKYETKMRPFFSLHLIGNRQNYFQNLLKPNNYLTPENENEILEVSFVMGENPGGYMVYDYDSEKGLAEDLRAKQVANKEIPIIVKQESFGFTISERLPSDVWSKLKPYATYWNAEEIDEWFDDMDDFHKVGEGKFMKGWYYTKDIIEILEQLGFTLEQKK